MIHVNNIHLIITQRQKNAQVILSPRIRCKNQNNSFVAENNSKSIIRHITEEIDTVILSRCALLKPKR